MSACSVQYKPNYGPGDACRECTPEHHHDEQVGALRHRPEQCQVGAVRDEEAPEHRGEAHPAQARAPAPWCRVLSVVFKPTDSYTRASDELVETERSLRFSWSSAASEPQVRHTFYAWAGTLHS